MVTKDHITTHHQAIMATNERIHRVSMMATKLVLVMVKKE